MVSSSDRQFQKEHKGSSTKIPSNHGSKHAVTKQPPIKCGLRYVINALRTNCQDSLLLETFIRGVVRDVVESKIQERLLSSEKVNQAAGIISGARPLELCFINNHKLPDTVFTKTSIISKDEPLQIALVDVRSNSIVNHGPFSSIKIQICALNGEFGSCDSTDDWTEIKFNDNILRERNGKEPLLAGDHRIITLENGVASISKIMFTDNSRWLRCKKFRLGVKAMQNGENIKEGRSKPFRVKDNRGESYQKHYPPCLNDDVWRLKRIAKDGIFHKRLSFHGIHTVMDFLKLLIINESSLHEKFEQIPKKSWLAIIEHAKSCVVDDRKLYRYATSGQTILLLFDAIFKLVAVTFDAQNFYLPDTLTPSLKNLVESLKQDAYKNVNNLEPIDDSTLNSISLAACLKSAAPSYAHVQGLQHIDISSTQGQKETRPSYVQPCISTSYVNEGMNNCQINVAQGGYLTENLMNVSDIYTTLGPGNDILYKFSDGAECSTRVNFVDSYLDISGNEKPKAVWRKICAVIKWSISVRRVAAAKRDANLIYFNY